MRSGIRFSRVVLLSVLFLCFAECRSSAKQVAVIVNHANAAQDVSSTDITKIFKCGTRKWADGTPISVVMRDPSSPEMELLLARVYKISPEEMKNFIATHRDVILVVDSNAAMLAAVRSTPGAIGLIDVYSITQEVKVLKIDGKLPVEYGYFLRGN
jgi:ABC-type phosphate transport system substrate-binding protein